jgi:hypothetical protein
MERGESVNGISAMDMATVVLTDRNIYLVSGYGPDNLGRGDDMSRLTSIPTDDGCIEPRSVVSYPEGVFFQSSRGLYELSRGQGVASTGEPVRDLLDAYPVVTSAVVVPGERQVRWTVTNEAGNDGRIIVYDYRIKAWFEWQVYRGSRTTFVPVGATFVDGTYFVTDANGTVMFEDTTTHYDDATNYVPMVIETGEIQPAGVGQWMQVTDVVALCEKVDAHQAKVTFAYDYQATPGSAEATWSAAIIDSMHAPTVREQLARKPSTVRMQSFRVRIEDDTDGTPTTGAGFVAHAITAQVAILPGGPRVEAQARM